MKLVKTSFTTPVASSGGMLNFFSAMSRKRVA
jgi:hypothetical protein